MAGISNYIEELINQLTKFPGIGRKGAERMVYHMIRSGKDFPKELINAVSQIHEHITSCDQCGMIYVTDENCSCSEDRNTKSLCIVEDIEDAIRIENTKAFDGLYHVLGGSIAPLDGIGPADLSFNRLMERLEGIEEVIIATNPSNSGNTTAQYIEKLLEDKDVSISRLATGLPVGSSLEYIDDKTLVSSINGRVKIK